MNRFDEYLNSLKTAESGAYLELDKSNELSYMERHKYRFEKILEGIPNSTNCLRILDIGATPFTLFIKDAYPHFEIAALDLTNLLAARFEEKNVQLRVCNLETQPIPFDDNYFDIIIFAEVFEHLLPPTDNVLREVSRVLRIGGKLIFSTPNFAQLINRIRLLVGINPLAPVDEQFKRGWVHGYGHVREYTMKEVTEILSYYNFIILKKKFISSNPNVRSIENSYQLLEQLYLLVCLLVPAFRETMYLECYKSSTTNPRARSFKSD
jgi:SAM-dependent methyltransferase